MTLKVLISAPYMIPVLDQFRKFFEAEGIELVEPHVEERLSEEELMLYAGEIDGVICGDDYFTARVIEAATPRLKVISKWGTGIDSIDAEAATRFDVRVCNTPGAFSNPVADSVMSYVLAFARQLPWLDRAMKAGHWEKIVGRSLSECSLGVIGVGRIGKQVLRRAVAFGMRLMGNDIVTIPADFVTEVGVEMLSLERLLSKADFISMNCDLNPTSYHLLDHPALAQVRPGAVVINTSRGPVIDEGALIAALQEGRIAGAGLDVFEDEPLPLESPLRSMDNVLLGPHNSNSSPTAYEQVHWNTLRNLFEGLGLTIPHQDKNL